MSLSLKRVAYDDHAHPQIGHSDLLQLGMGQVAYVRPICIMNKNMFAVHAADGTPLSVFDTETDAVQALTDNDLQAVRIQ